jgi:hypothetical protein
MALLYYGFYINYIICRNAGNFKYFSPQKKIVKENKGFFWGMFGNILFGGHKIFKIN